MGLNDELVNPSMVEQRKRERHNAPQGDGLDVEALVPMDSSVSAQGQQRSIQEDLERWGITNLPTLEVTKEMLIIDMRSKFLRGTKAIYAEWLSSGLIQAKQSFDLKEATDKVIFKGPLSIFVD